jgi:hypothetical protein
MLCTQSFGEVWTSPSSALQPEFMGNGSTNAIFATGNARRRGDDESEDAKSGPLLDG